MQPTVPVKNGSSTKQYTRLKSERLTSTKTNSLGENSVAEISIRRPNLFW